MSNLQHNKQPFLLLGTTSEGESIILTGQEFSRFKWVQGISGSGKSTFLAWLVLSLLRLGIIVVLIDPHGDLARLCLNLLASSDFFKHPKTKGFERLHFIDFARRDAAPAFNVLKQEHINNYKVAQNFLESIKRAWPSSTSTTALDNTVEYAAFVLAECGLPITQFQRFLLDASFRNTLLAKIKDQQIIQFFNFTFSDKVNSTLIASTMRRLDLLTFSPTLRASLGQRTNILSFRSMWGKDVSCLISLGGLSESEKRLVGCLLLVSIEQHFLSRLELPPEKRSKVALIVDEAPLFISQDETSFTNILEQCRKAGATCTTFANQTLTQLSKGMLGSLQNALPIMFKAGTQDSSELASRFYRPTIEENMSLYDFLSLSPAPTPGVFSTVRNTQEARMIFEQLQRQEAIVMLPDKAVKITTPTLPVKIDQKKLAEIEHEYAKRLLTPLSQIEREVAGSNLLVVSSAPKSSSLATRRIASVPLVESKPLQIVTGSLSDDLLNALFHLHYATLSQLCKFLGRETSINHVRNKLNNLKADGMVDSTTLPVTAGKPPTIWFLTPSTRKDKADSLGLPIPLATGEKKHGYLEHTLACNEVLISSIPLPQVKPQFTLMNLKHERTLKNSAIKISEGVYLVPDGWVHLRLNNVEDIGFCFEIDRNTEEKEKIIAKLNNYVMFASGIYQKTFGLSSLSIAFCVTEGGDRRVKQLVSWAEQTLAGNKDAAALFLFGSVPPGSLEPESFFLDATFLTPFDIPPHALVDIL